MPQNQIENSKRYSILITILVLIICILFCALGFYINNTNQQNQNNINNLNNSNSNSSSNYSFNLSDELKTYSIFSDSDMIVSVNDKTKKVFLNSHTILQDEMELKFQTWLQEKNYKIPDGYSYIKCDKLCNESLFAKPDSTESQNLSSNSQELVSSSADVSSSTNSATSSNAN